MERDKLMRTVAAILATAYEAEADHRPLPESYGYIALGMDLEEWTTIKSALKVAGYCTWEGNQAHLTNEGREIGRKAVAIFNRRKEEETAAVVS